MKTRTLALPAMMLIAALTGACTTMTLPPANMPVLLDFQRREIQRDYLNRYACADARPLMCTCWSRLSTTCDCSCNRF